MNAPPIAAHRALVLLAFVLGALLVNVTPVGAGPSGPQHSHVAVHPAAKPSPPRHDHAPGSGLLPVLPSSRSFSGGQHHAPAPMGGPVLAPSSLLPARAPPGLI